MRLRTVARVLVGGLLGSALLQSAALAFATVAGSAIAALVVITRRRLFTRVDFVRGLSRGGGAMGRGARGHRDPDQRQAAPAGVVASPRRLAYRARRGGVRAAAEPAGAAGTHPDRLRALVRACAPEVPGPLRASRPAPLRAGRAGRRRPLRHRRRHQVDPGVSRDHGAPPCARDSGIPGASGPPARGGSGPAVSRRRPDRAQGHASLPSGRSAAGDQLARHRAHRRAAHQRVRPHVARSRTAAPRRGLSVQVVGGHTTLADGGPVRGRRLAGVGLRDGRVRGRDRVERVAGGGRRGA